MLIRSSLPKVLKGSLFCGKAADCWSVGATLFTMLAGFSPFETDEAEVREIIRSEEIKPLRTRAILFGRQVPHRAYETNPEPRLTCQLPPCRRPLLALYYVGGHP